jgi:predicted nucleic acid-binding protein
MIAYDSNILVYYLEDHPEFGDAAARIVEASNRDGAVLSVLVWQEVLSGFALRSPGDAKVALAAIEALQQTTFADITKQVVKRATALTERFGRKVVGYDAIHLATALEHEATHFYTNDLELVKIGRIEGLKITGLDKP